MKKMMMLAALMLCAGAAHAGILDLRGGVGLSGANADDFENKVNSVGGGGIHAKEFQTYNADVFFNIPACPVGVGLRQDWLNVSDSGNNGSDLDLKASVTSLLVDLRIIDSKVFYVGPIVGIGYPTANIDYTDGTVRTKTRVTGRNVAYNGGLEAGFYIGPLILGAEAGYQSIKLKNANGNTLNADFDASGVYGKAMVGLTLF